jgi:hypothetical protein
MLAQPDDRLVVGCGVGQLQSGLVDRRVDLGLLF